MVNRARSIADPLADDLEILATNTFDYPVDRVNQAHARVMQPAKNEFAALMQQLNAQHDKKK